MFCNETEATDEHNIHYVLICHSSLIISSETHNIIKPSNHL